MTQAISCHNDNSTITVMYWNIGFRINQVILNNYAEYENK